LFLFIGADPNTDWLAGSDVGLDAKGFVLTGEDAGGDRHELETTLPGFVGVAANVDARAKTSRKNMALRHPATWRTT
jgi:thioredoxin reductase